MEKYKVRQRAKQQTGGLKDREKQQMQIAQLLIETHLPDTPRRNNETHTCRDEINTELQAQR
jgi:hypothetical protein